MRYFLYSVLALIGAFTLELAFLHFFGIGTSERLEKLGWAGESITGIAAVIAIVGFWYQAKHDSNLAATEIVGFFREKVIPEKDKFNDEVDTLTKKKFNFQEQNVLLEKFTLWWFRLYYRELADKQDNLLKEFPQLTTNLVKLFNVLEELALKMKYLNLVSHPALASIRPGCIGIIENSSSWVLGYITLSEKGYPGLRFLYESWKEYGDRDSQEARMNKVMDKTRLEVQEHQRELVRGQNLFKKFFTMPFKRCFQWVRRRF